MFLHLDLYECCGFSWRTLRLQGGGGKEVSACSLSSLACQRAENLGPALKQVCFKNTGRKVIFKRGEQSGDNCLGGGKEMGGIRKAQSYSPALTNQLT